MREGENGGGVYTAAPATSHETVDILINVLGSPTILELH